MIRTRGPIQWTLRYFLSFYICIISFIISGTSCNFSQKILKLCHHSQDKSPCGQKTNVGLGNNNDSNNIVYYDNGIIHYHDSKQNPYKTDESNTNFYENSIDTIYPRENNQNVIMYLAGYDNEIFKLKDDIVKHGVGNEILVYFFLYKDRNYYNLGNIYTNLKVLEDNIAKYTHYFCLDKISLKNAWCLDKADHLQRYLTNNNDNIQKNVQIVDSNDEKPISSYEFIFPKEKDLTIKDILVNMYKFKDKKANKSPEAITNKQIKTNYFDKENAVVYPELYQGNNNAESMYYLDKSINSDKNDLINSNQFYIHKGQSDEFQGRPKIGYWPSHIMLKETNFDDSPEAQSYILSNASSIYAHDTKEMNMEYNKSNDQLGNFNEYNQLFELKIEKTFNKSSKKPCYLRNDNNNKDAYVFSGSKPYKADLKNQNVNNIIERPKDQNYKEYYDSENDGLLNINPKIEIIGNENNTAKIQSTQIPMSKSMNNVYSSNNDLNLKLINKTGYIDESKENISYFPTTQDMDSKTICDSKNLKNPQFDIKEPYATSHQNATNETFNKQQSISYTDSETTDTKKDKEKIAYFPFANALESKEIHDSIKKSEETKYDNQEMQMIDQRPEIITYIEPDLLKDINIKDNLKPNYQEIVNNNQEPLQYENMYLTPTSYSGKQITTPINLNSNADLNSVAPSDIKYEMISSENEPKYFNNVTSSSNNYPFVSYLDTSYINQNGIFNPNIIQPSNLHSYDSNSNLFSTYTQNLEPINYPSTWSEPYFNYYDNIAKIKSKMPQGTYFSQYTAPENKLVNIKLPPVTPNEMEYKSNPSYVSIPNYTLNQNVIPIELKDNITYGNMSEKGLPNAILGQDYNPNLFFEQQAKGYSTITTPDIVKMTLTRPNDGQFVWKLLPVNANLKETSPQLKSRGEFSTKIYPFSLRSYYSPYFNLNQEMKSDKLSKYQTYIDDVNQSKQATVSNNPNVQSIDYRLIPNYINNYDYVSDVGIHYKNESKLPDENTILIATKDTNLPKFNFPQVINTIPEKVLQAPNISPEINQSVSSVFLDNRKESISPQLDLFDTSSTESENYFELHPESNIPISDIDVNVNYNKGDSDINKINVIPYLNRYEELKKYIPSKATSESIKLNTLKESVPYHLYHFYPSSSNVDSSKLYEPNAHYSSEWFEPRTKNVKQQDMINIQPISNYSEPYNVFSPEPNILTSETYDSSNVIPSVNKYIELDSKVENYEPLQTTYEPSLISEEFKSIREPYKSLKPNQPGSFFTMLPMSNVDFSMQLQPNNLSISSKSNIPYTFERLKPLVNKATENIFSPSPVALHIGKFPEINVPSSLKTYQSTVNNNKKPYYSNIVNVIPCENQNLKLDSHLRNYNPVKIEYAPGLPAFSLKNDELMAISKSNNPISLEINELKHPKGDVNTNYSVTPTTNKNIELDFAFAQNEKPEEIVYQSCHLSEKYKLMPKLRQENFKHPESLYTPPYSSNTDLSTKLELSVPLSDNKQNNLMTIQYPIAHSISHFAPNVKENIKLFTDTIPAFYDNKTPVPNLATASPMPCQCRAHLDYYQQYTPTFLSPRIEIKIPTKVPTSFKKDYISTISAPSNTISLPSPLVSFYAPTSSNYASEAPVSQRQSHVIKPSTTDIYLDTLHSTLPTYKVLDTNNLRSVSPNFVSPSPVSQKTKTPINFLEMTTDTFANPLQSTSPPSKTYTYNQPKDNFDKNNKISNLTRQPHVNNQYKILDNIINAVEGLNEIPQKGYTLTSPASLSTAFLSPIPSDSMLFTYIPSSFVSPSSISLTRNKSIESLNMPCSDIYINPAESTLSTFYQNSLPSFEISNNSKDSGINNDISSITSVPQVNEQQKKYNNTIINVVGKLNEIPSSFQKDFTSTTPVSFNTISSVPVPTDFSSSPLVSPNVVLQSPDLHNTFQQTEDFKIPIANANVKPLQNTPLIQNVYDIFNKPKNTIIKYSKSPYLIRGQTNHLQKNYDNLINVVESQSDTPIPIKTDFTLSSPALNVAPLIPTPSVSIVAHPTSNLVFQAPTPHKTSKEKFSLLPIAASYSIGYNEPKDTSSKNNTISYLFLGPQNKTYKVYDHKINVVERQKESLAPVPSDSISLTVASSNAILPTTVTDKLKKTIASSKMPLTNIYLKDMQSVPTTSEIIDTPIHNVVTYKSMENVPKFAPHTLIPEITPNLKVFRPTYLPKSYIAKSYVEIKPQNIDMKPEFSIQAPPLSKTYPSSTSELKSFTPFSPIEVKPTKQVYEETQPKYSYIKPPKIKEYVSISEIPKYNLPYQLLKSIPNTQITYYLRKFPTVAANSQLQKWPQNIIYLSSPETKQSSNLKTRNYPSITNSVKLNNIQAPTYQVPIRIPSSSKNALFYKPIYNDFESKPSVQNFNLKPTLSFQGPLRNILENIIEKQPLSPSTLSLMSERYPQSNVIVPKIQPQFVPLSNYQFYTPATKFEDSHLKPHMKYTLPYQMPVTNDRSTIISTEKPQLMPSSTKLQSKPVLKPKPSIKWLPDIIENKQSVPNQYHMFMYPKTPNRMTSVPPKNTFQSTASISPVQPCLHEQNSYTYLQPPSSTVSVGVHSVKETYTHNVPRPAKILSSPYQIPYTSTYSKAPPVPQFADIIQDIQLSSLPQNEEIHKKGNVNFIPLEPSFMTLNSYQLPTKTSPKTSKPGTSSVDLKPLMGEVVQDNIIKEQPSSKTVTKSNKWYLPYTLPKIELVESSPSSPNFPCQVTWLQAYQKVKPQVASTSQNYQPPLTFYDRTALDKNSIDTKLLTPIKNSVSYLSYLTPMNTSTSQSTLRPYTSSKPTYPLADQNLKMSNGIKTMYLTNKKLPSPIWSNITFKPILSNIPSPTKSPIYYQTSTIKVPLSIPTTPLPCQSVWTKAASYCFPHIDSKIQSDQILKMSPKTLTYSSPTNLHGSKKPCPTSYTYTNAHKAQTVQTQNEILETDKEIKDSTPYVLLDSKPNKAYQVPCNLPISDKIDYFDNKKSGTEIADNIGIDNYYNFKNYQQNKQNVYKETPDLKTQIIQSYAPINPNIFPMPYITYTQKQTPIDQFIADKNENLANVVDNNYAQTPSITEVPCNKYTFPTFGIDISNGKYNYYNSVNYLQNEQPNIHQETPNYKLFYSILHPKAYSMSDNYKRIQPTTSTIPCIKYKNPTKFEEPINDKTDYKGHIIMRKDGNLEAADAKILGNIPEVNYNIRPVNQITAPLPNIGVIKYQPYEINNEIKIQTDNPDIGIRAWKSKLKIVKFRIVADIYETEAYNFEPIIERKYIKKYDLQTVEDTVKKYVKKYYGEPIVLKGVYSFYKPYAIYNINEKYINEGLYFIWPILCQCGCDKFGCRCQI